MLEIGIQDLLDCIRHVRSGKTRADDLADRGARRRRAAERDLVVFLALLIEAEDTDMADMVMAAGIDAARDVDLKRTDILLAIIVCKFARDRLGNRDRAGGGQGAVIKAGAGDDVAGETEVRRGEIGGR